MSWHGLEEGEGSDNGVDEIFGCHGNGQGADMHKNIIHSLISLETSKLLYLKPIRL